MTASRYASEMDIAPVVDLRPFNWTDDATSTAKRLYFQGVSLALAAAEVGCTAKQLDRKAYKMGWRAQRSPEISQRLRMEGARRGADATSRACAALRAATSQATPDRTDADLIAAAIAAGKVTVLRPGHAAGTTAWEAALGRCAVSPEWHSPQANQTRRRGRIRSALSRAAKCGRTQ